MKSKGTYLLSRRTLQGIWLLFCFSPSILCSPGIAPALPPTHHNCACLSVYTLEGISRGKKRRQERCCALMLMNISGLSTLNLPGGLLPYLSLRLKCYHHSLVAEEMAFLQNRRAHLCGRQRQVGEGRGLEQGHGWKRHCGRVTESPKLKVVPTVDRVSTPLPT